MVKRVLGSFDLPDEGDIIDQAAAGQEQVKKKTTGLKTVTLGVVADYYHKQLYKKKKGYTYLESIGITDKTLLSRYRIGYADGSLLDLISNGQREKLAGFGVLTPSGREVFTGCVVFPFTDANGKVRSLYGRKVSGIGEATCGAQGFFNLRASKVYDEVVLTESVFDALALIQLGIGNVLAFTGELTQAHIKTLKDNLLKTIVLALYTDGGGKEKADALRDSLVDAGFTVKVALPPRGKNWKDWLTEGRSKEDVLEAIDEAETFGPEPEAAGFTVKCEGQRYLFTIGKITYRVLGAKRIFVSSLKVNIRAEHGDTRYLDNVDLYSARSRLSYSQNLARIIECEVQGIENDLLKIVEYLEAERDAAMLEYKEEAPPLTAEDRQLGRELLESPDLFDRITDDLEVLGYVGEQLNKQLIYIAASSRKMADPISILILSQSASGKSLLVETVRKLIPPEDVVAISSLSDQALNYVAPGGLLHKFLVLGEAVHSDVVEHQIREMLSNHELSRMVTMKDEKTGTLLSQTIRTEVIVSAVMSSTSYVVNPENASRCFVINADESTEQTRRIQYQQKEKYSITSILKKKNRIPYIIRQHHAAQRMLENVFITNPLAQFLDFPSNLMRTRRDHDRFMDLIAGVCHLRQMQKERKETVCPESGEIIEYIECDIEDYKIAHAIITGILPATLMNVPKGAALLYEQLRELARIMAKAAGVRPEEVRFTQREVREYTGHNQMFVKRYMHVLTDYEFVRKTQGAYRGGRSSYQLVKDEDMRLFDLSMIPTPAEIAEKAGQL